MKPIALLPVTLLAVGIALAVHAADAPLRPTDLTTRTLHADAGRAYTSPSKAAPADVVAGYLRAQGRSEATIKSLRVRGQGVQARKGIRFLRLGQEVGGLAVYDTYAKAAIDPRGQLVSLVENLVPAPAKLTPATIDEVAALNAAIRALNIPTQATRVLQRNGATTRFARGDVFVENPLVTRVAVPMSDGSMQIGFLVQTWRTSGNRLAETLVGGDGRVVETVPRTNTDNYNVFVVDPEKSAQAIVSGAGNNWLFAGPHTAQDIAGNNVHAYLDAVNDGMPDGGGTAVANGDFLSAFDPAVEPSTDTNRNVAVQNLFYLNNVIHDRLYAAGFDEVAGNFQENNGGLGGRGSDSVNAEAQDGGGTDNANFATPRDGQNPRMQMYLWSGLSPHSLTTQPGGASYESGVAEFGLQQFDLNASLAAAVPNYACSPLTNGAAVSGKIVVVDRSLADDPNGCTFVVKAQNVQAAGGIGMIVANREAGTLNMAGEGATLPPSLLVSQADGAAIKQLIAGGAATAAMFRGAPDVMRDGDLDSDIVWHEYGHGLTWRMIGRMDGPMSGAIGEGMSDVLSVIVNNDDAVGEYSVTNTDGIRSQRYANYTRTYADVTGSEVHFDGEVYGAIGWRVWKNLQGIGDGADDALAVLVDGMNYTPAHPKFEDMRDGILAGLAGDLARQCLVWEAFAHYGVGVGAKGAVRGSKVIVTGSTALPAQCQ